jgi:hypothetical protein
MTTRRRHPAARARLVVAAVSASVTAALLGGMAAEGRSAGPASAETPDRAAAVQSAPLVHPPGSPPVTTSHVS